MFKHLSHFKFALLYIFSKQARFAGKFDERDLLLGHGIDNLTSIRVVVSLCCAIAVYLLVNFVLSSQVVSALLFILVMEVLCWYTMHLPRSGMEQALHNNFAKLKEHRSYRSYFNGRILFTPYGLSLSLKARNAQTVSKERNEQAKRILSLQPLSTNRFSQWFNKVTEVNHKINAHSHKELSCVQVTQGLSKAQSEHNARLYLSGHGHKSTAMILQSGVSVDDYVIAQGILASTADDRDLPVINSGYITKLPVPLLCDQRLYAGKKITMEAIAQILCASAMQESNKQHRKFVPTDLCLLGFGFEWLPKHSRALRQIMAVGTKAAPLGGDGSPDIHAVEPDFAYEPIVTSTNKLKGHTLLLGTTGSGKTRFFDLLVSQAIMRGDTVIVLDPKGDRDLQRSIIKAARAAEREPYQQIICLDIGRNVSNPLSSNVAVDYAAASTGSLKQFAMDSKKISDTQNIAPLSPFERSRKSLTKKGYFSLINNDFYERQGCDLGFDKAADTKERRSFKYQHRHYISEHNETATSIRATNSRYDDPNFATVTGEDPDNCLFDEINFGLNPTAIFDRGSEVSSRLTSMISGQGSSANFKAYAAMAITAAVECCRLLDENVTLDAIRGYIANHQRFIIAVRDIINKTVVNLNNVYCSRYYNCIYGIKDDKLVRNAYTISVLMANGYKYINLRERASVLSVLENSGLLDASDAQVEDSEKIKQIENIIDNQSLTKEIISDKAASKKTSSKTTTAKENKPRYLAAPAPIKSLQEFYIWMTKNGYLDRDNSIEQIFEVCLMDPVFFQKVTNSIMPSLVSLTSGVLKQLLSADDYKQTNFMEIVRNNKIFYGALHCLKDSITGQNLGKLLMADLAFVAGEINAKNIQGHHQVSVFIDEASELANEVLVQLLNKSRASNFAVTIATQSVADLRARVNSKDVAEQLIANCNNLLSLRVEDMDTANVIANVLPNTVCTHESTTISVGSGGLTGNASASRSLSQQDCEYFPGTMLMQLPNFEFIARLANGSCYKGFIPIIDKENSGHQRPEFTAAHEAQAFAQEQNKRMRSQTFEPRPNNTTNTSSNISPTPQRTSDFATSSPMEDWPCPEQSQPNINGNTAPISRQYDLSNNNANTNSLNSPISPVSGLNNRGLPNGMTAPINGPISSCARLDNFGCPNANTSSLNGPTSSCARLDNFDGDMANNSSLNGHVSSCARLDNFDGDMANNSNLNGPVSSCARLDNFGCNMANSGPINGGEAQGARLDNSGKAQYMGQGAKGTWWRKIIGCLHICDSYRENTSNEAGVSKCSSSGDEADIYRNRGSVGIEFGASCQQGNEGANTSKNDGDGLNAKDIDGKPLAGGENFVSGKEQPNEKKISGCTLGQNMLKIEIALQDASRDKFNDTATSSLSLAQSLVTLPSSHHDPQRQRFNAYVQARRNAQAIQNLKVQARQNPCTPNNSTDSTPKRQSDFASNLQFNRDAQGNLQTQPDFQERIGAAAQAQVQALEQEQVRAQAQACAQAHAYAQAQSQSSEARSIQNHATDIELKLSSSRINEELTLEQAAIMLGQDPKDALEANLTPDNVKLDGPDVGRYGYKAGNSRQTLNQETKVYVGNEQSLLYSHFSDEQYHPKSSDDLVQRQSGFTKTASTTGASGEASAASASASASGATVYGSTNRTSGTDGIRGISGIRSATGALSCNDKRGEPQLSSNGYQAEHNFSPAPIMVSALSTSKSKMDRDYEQAQTYRRQNLKSNERNLLTMGGEIQAQYGLTGLLIWFLRVLFYPLEWALKVLIKVCFNQSLLKNLAIAKELMMLLLAGVLIAWCFKPDQIAVLTKSISDFCSYCYDFGAVVYFALFNGFSQVNEALYADSSILDRLDLYAQLLFDHVECALTCFALGLLWGNHYGLISEMHHRSLLGLRTLLRPYSFLNLSLSLSAVALLIGGYFPCLEYALLITWFKIALYGFTITCFYSQHSK